MRHEVGSPIGGSVESHVTSVGQQVEIGTVLVTVECMKTMFPVDSPAGGTVAWLKPCGDNVEAGDVVVVIESNDVTR